MTDIKGVKFYQRTQCENAAAIVLAALLDGYKVKTDIHSAGLERDWYWDEGVLAQVDDGRVTQRYPSYELDCFVTFFNSQKEIYILA